LESSNFDKFPEVRINGLTGYAGWQDIIQEIQQTIRTLQSKKIVIAVECYHGVQPDEGIRHWQQFLPGARILFAGDAMLPEPQVEKLVHPYVTDDPVFGYITPLELKDFFVEQKITALQKNIHNITEGIIIIYGTGATIIEPKPDILIYADMPRWEIQLRFRRNEITNLGANNAQAAFSYQYKRAFFVDWRICDRHKVKLMEQWDYVLDTTINDKPKMVAAAVLLQAFEEMVKRPFRVVPFFDPGPWGGQWLKEVCDLETSEPNIAWGFDCVPEENSLLIRFENMVFETPAINLVFYQPEKLLGKKVYTAFGAEFPIRFDFLDTMEGGNLSLQVHPLKEYIREKFGMAYTQDESYYFLQAKKDAFVYLGLKEKIEPERMMQDLEAAQKNGKHFDADVYVEKWPVKQHDHVLIPAGTVHCSGANSVVLEISATPYIFTFKLWDWGRMGLDGKPRPISLEHGKQVIQWDRTTQWTKQNIINQFETIAQGDGWKEERTGLHAASFIETRRHWFTGKVHHNTNGVVNVLNLIEGREVIVESEHGLFEPFIVHYAETFIVPAAAGGYTIRPYGEAAGKLCATIKAYVRTENLMDYRIN
jgi:mannose-6-phosphate isomerase class I